MGVARQNRRVAVRRAVDSDRVMISVSRKDEDWGARRPRSDVTATPHGRARRPPCVCVRVCVCVCVRVCACVCACVSVVRRHLGELRLALVLDGEVGADDGDRERKHHDAAAHIASAPTVRFLLPCYEARSFA